MLGTRITLDGELTEDRARAMLAAVKACDTPLLLRVNSIGGDFELALEIYGALQGRGQPSLARIKAAESSAVLMCMGASRVEIERGGYIVVHHPWRHGRLSWRLPDGTEIKGQDVRVPMRGTLADRQVEIFARRTGIPPERIAAMLDKETRLPAPLAVQLRFADALA